MRERMARFRAGNRAISALMQPAERQAAGSHGAAHLTTRKGGPFSMSAERFIMMSATEEMSADSMARQMPTTNMGSKLSSSFVSRSRRSQKDSGESGGCAGGALLAPAPEELGASMPSHPPPGLRAAVGLQTMQKRGGRRNNSRRPCTENSRVLV